MIYHAFATFRSVIHAHVFHHLTTTRQYLAIEGKSMSVTVWPPISHEQLIKEEEDSLVVLENNPLQVSIVDVM